MLPFRADHIGSLLRPNKLREAFRTGNELQAVQDESVRDVVGQRVLHIGAELREPAVLDPQDRCDHIDGDRHADAV